MRPRQCNTSFVSLMKIGHDPWKKHIFTSATLENYVEICTWFYTYGHNTHLMDIIGCDEYGRISSNCITMLTRWCYCFCFKKSHTIVDFYEWNRVAFLPSGKWQKKGAKIKRTKAKKRRRKSEKEKPEFRTKSHSILI